MKIYYFLFLLSFSLFYSQNTKVMRIQDAVDGKPLTHARISFDNEIFIPMTTEKFLFRIMRSI